MPEIEITKTKKGSFGNKIVPAKTNGVLGKSVNPREMLSKK